MRLISTLTFSSLNFWIGWSITAQKHRKRIIFSNDKNMFILLFMENISQRATSETELFTQSVSYVFLGGVHACTEKL